jgi:hypothetical protein
MARGYIAASRGKDKEYENKTEDTAIKTIPNALSANIPHLLSYTITKIQLNQCFTAYPACGHCCSNPSKTASYYYNIGVPKHWNAIP